MPYIPINARQVRVPGGNLWDALADLQAFAQTASFGSLLTADTAAGLTVNVAGKTDSLLTLTDDADVDFIGFPAGHFSEHTVVIQQDETGDHDLTLPGITWLSGEPPEMPHGAGEQLLFHIRTYDGATLLGMHSQMIRTYTYCWPGPTFKLTTKAPPWRPRRRVRVVGFRLYCLDAVAGSETRVNGYVDNALSMFPNNTAMPRIAAGQVDSGIINTHTTKVITGEQFFIPRIEAVGATPGGYGNLDLYFVES